MQRGLLSIGATALLALVVACGDSEQKPVSPTSPTAAAAATGSNAAGDSATLKVNGPTPTSPTGGQRLQNMQAVLTFAAATGKYVQGETFTYEVQLLNAGGTPLETQTGSALSYTMKTALDADTNYSWRVRAVMEGRYGPWSSNATFKSMEQPSAYARGDELYDPLTAGVPSAIISAHGNAAWFPGVGVKLLNRQAFVEYFLPTTLVEGEVSFEATGIRNDGWEWKTKIMSMEDALGIPRNTTENPFRVTVDKRSDWLGQGSRVRFTMRSNGHDAGEERSGPHAWDKNRVYGWRFQWRGGTADLYVYDGGFDGPVKEHLTCTYDEPYAPLKHLVRLGSPVGRGDPESLPDVVIRHLWVSKNPRPSWATSR